MTESVMRRAQWSRWASVALVVLAAALAVVAYQQPLLAAAGVAAILLFILAYRWPSFVFSAMMLALPFHVMVQRLLRSQLHLSAAAVDIFSLWKEAVIGVLLLTLFLRTAVGDRRVRLQLRRADMWLAPLVAVAGAYVLVAPMLTIGVFGFRNYFEPILIFYLVRLIPFNRRQLRWLLTAMIVVAVLVALFGIYQARFFSFADLRTFGYLDASGQLPNAMKTSLTDRNPRPRAASTFTGPNELGVYLTLFILLALNRFPRATSLRRWLYSGAMGICAGCLFLTLSRSALVALAVGLFTLVVLILRDHGTVVVLGRIWGNKRLLVGGVIGLILVVAAAFAAGVPRRVARTFNLEDPSAAGHIRSLQQSAAFVGQQPMGIGIGMVGPRAKRFGTQVKTEHSESTYLQIAMEIGLLGVFLVIAYLVAVVVALERIRRRLPEESDIRAVSQTAVAFWVGGLAAFTFLPLFQNLVLASYMWFLAGISFKADRLVEEQ